MLLIMSSFSPQLQHSYAWTAMTPRAMQSIVGLSVFLLSLSLCICTCSQLVLAAHSAEDTATLRASDEGDLVMEPMEDRCIFGAAPLVLQNPQNTSQILRLAVDPGSGIAAINTTLPLHVNGLDVLAELTRLNARLQVVEAGLAHDPPPPPPPPPPPKPTAAPPTPGTPTSTPTLHPTPQLDSAGAKAVKRIASLGSGHFGPQFRSLRMRSDNRPVVAFLRGEQPDQEVLVAVCQSPSCSNDFVHSAVVIDSSYTSTNAVSQVALALTASDFPRVAVLMSPNVLILVVCNDLNCTSSTLSNVSVPLATIGTSSGIGFMDYALDMDDYPVFVLSGEGKLVFHRCFTKNCSSNQGTEIGIAVDASASTEMVTSLNGAQAGWVAVSLGPSAAMNPRLAFKDSLGIHVVICSHQNCSAGDVAIVLVDAADVGLTSPLALEVTPSQVVLVAHCTESANDLRLVSCNDADCLAASAAFVKRATTGGPPASIQRFENPSLAISSAGLPVLAVTVTPRSNDDLHLFFCQDLTCSSHTERVIDAVGPTGFNPDLQLTSTDVPVVAYHYGLGGSTAVSTELRVMHCGGSQLCNATYVSRSIISNSTFRALGIDESVHVPPAGVSSTSNGTFAGPRLALSRFDYLAVEQTDVGLPVMVVASTADRRLVLVCCLDYECAFVQVQILANETVLNSPPSLSLTATDGFPRVAFATDTGKLQVLVCHDSACSTSTISTADTGPAQQPSITMRGNIPALAFVKGLGFLPVLALCLNSLCSQTSEPEDLYSNPALALASRFGVDVNIGVDDDTGRLYVVVLAQTAGTSAFGETRVFQCGDAACSPGAMTVATPGNGGLNAVSGFQYPPTGHICSSVTPAKNMLFVAFSTPDTGTEHIFTAGIISPMSAPPGANIPNSIFIMEDGIFADRSGLYDCSMVVPNTSQQPTYLFHSSADGSTTRLAYCSNSDCVGALSTTPSSASWYNHKFTNLPRVFEFADQSAGATGNQNSAPGRFALLLHQKTGLPMVFELYDGLLSVILCSDLGCL